MTNLTFPVLPPRVSGRPASGAAQRPRHGRWFRPTAIACGTALNLWIVMLALGGLHAAYGWVPALGLWQVLLAQLVVRGLLGSYRVVTPTRP